jgi:alpha-L-fucosidase
VGEWVRRNGESVYGTSASPFGAFYWGTCTVKGSRLYLHVFEWPRDGVLRLAGLKNTARAAHMLSAPGQALATEKNAAGVLVRLPAAAPDPVDSVVVLELEGAPRVDPPVVAQQGATPLRLDYMAAVTSGATRKRFNRRGGFHISRWTVPADRAAWRVRVATPGRYKVKIRYAAQPEWKGAKYLVAVGARTLAGTVEASPGWYEYRVFDLGAVEVPKAGEVAVSVHPAADAGHDLMYFESLELAPAK